jgi:hypothetical protein
LIAETSCEIRNEFLDRALVSPTVSANPEIGDPSFWEFIVTIQGAGRLTANFGPAEPLTAA